MNFASARRGRRPALLGIVGLLALVGAACQPGFVNPLAGTGQPGSTGDTGPAVDATFAQPGPIVYAPSGAYYVLDVSTCVIRKVDPGGMISTFAGTGTCGNGGLGSGPAAETMISPVALLSNITLDSAGNLYLSDSGNARVRRITPDGEMSTVQMANYDEIDLFTNAFSNLAVTSAGTLYVGTHPNGLWRRGTNDHFDRVVAGSVVTLAADPTGGIFYSDADGAVFHLDEGSSTPTPVTVLAAGSAPRSMAADAAGNLYAGVGDHLVRIAADGTVVNVAGNGLPDPASGAQSGDARTLMLSPYGVALTSNNGLLLSSGHVVYRLNHPASAPTSCDPARFFPGADLSGLDLSGTDLTGCDLSGVNLDGTDLTGTRLNGVRSGGVTGTPSALPAGWVLRSGWLIGPGALVTQPVTSGDFSGVDFSLVHLWGTGFVGVDLSGANLSWSHLIAPPFVIANSDLTGANLSGLDLSTTNFSGSTLTSAIIEGTDLGAADLTGVISGGLVGTPSALPPGWSIEDGVLVGP